MILKITLCPCKRCSCCISWRQFYAAIKLSHTLATSLHRESPIGASDYKNPSISPYADCYSALWSHYEQILSPQSVITLSGPINSFDTCCDTGGELNRLLIFIKHIRTWEHEYLQCLNSKYINQVHYQPKPGPISNRWLSTGCLRL